VGDFEPFPDLFIFVAGTKFTGYCDQWNKKDVLIVSESEHDLQRFQQFQ
jgi:hypothetical protein